MARVLAGLAAWLGGTAAAVCLAWFGAGMVVRSTTAGPAAPVISPPVSAVVAPPESTSAPPSAPPGGARRPASPSAPAARRPSSPSPAPAPSPSGQARSYALDGGQVTLLVTADSAQLVTAVPQAGFAVQSWSGPDWLRVDFSSGPDVSSLIASWNGHPPSVTVTNG